MEKTIILTGREGDIKQAIAELKSNIQYDNLNVEVIENGKNK